MRAARSDADQMTQQSAEIEPVRLAPDSAHAWWAGRWTPLGPQDLSPGGQWVMLDGDWRPVVPTPPSAEQPETNGHSWPSTVTGANQMQPSFLSGAAFRSRLRRLGFIGLGVVVCVGAWMGYSTWQAQRGASDQTMKSNVGAMGRSIADYYVSGTDPLLVEGSSGRINGGKGTWTLSDPTTGSVVDTGVLSAHVDIVGGQINGPNDWCVGVADSGSGSHTFWKETQDGLTTGDCP
jgi:hypothetical protein